MSQLLKDVCFSAKRALRGQTPKPLRAYSFAIDSEKRQLRLRAHFAQPPSEDDLEAISVAETEIDADFLDHFEAETDVEVASPGQPLSLLPGGTAYMREGKTGTICSQ